MKWTGEMYEHIMMVSVELNGERQRSIRCQRKLTGEHIVEVPIAKVTVTYHEVEVDGGNECRNGV